ncbi:MAG TPA: phosphate regulon sensor histidine kinase PhoR [Gammaproteobacteria bacterium]|nr:phosphate regulon sensor histidine kinase PhoR [Gammaproteobacteria bacterium]
MNADVWRFLAVLGFSLLTGLIAGHVLLCLLAGVLLFILWYYRELRRLTGWMENGAAAEPPELSGVIDDIAREFDLLQLRHRQRKKKLTRNLKRFQASMTALPDAVVVMDNTGAIQWVNERACAYLGINWPRDAGQRLTNLVRIPELAGYLATIRGTQADRGLQLPAPGNPALILELRVSRYGKTRQLMVARDVTRVQQVNQMRKDFIANASHELRTPLTVIAGYLEGLAHDPLPEPATLQRQIGQMRGQAARMQRLTEDLLQLALLESSPQTEEDEPVPIPELLAQVAAEARLLSGELRHAIAVAAEPVLWLRGSRKELYGAIMNLAQNAVAYTPAGGAITLRSYADAAGACLEVSDTGIGIEPQHIPRLTERFYRVDKGRSRDVGGTGLGLAIVRHVLDRHGATLEIQSKPGAGSVFRCRFSLSRTMRETVSEERDATG